ncbi:MAG: nitroreductase family protein [Mesorhizobium sp.]|jgi:nitroreductase
MDAIEAIRGRRSIRDYRAGRVPRALIEAILDDAAQAPTPPLSGEHPFAFLVIEGKKRVAECGALALRHAREHRPPGPGYDWVERPGFSVFFDAPAAVVICGADEALDQALQDCNRAGQNLMLSAHARGLGTCWVGSPMLWLRHPGTAAALGVPAGYRPCAAFALGYPATLPAPRGRPAPAVVWAA